MSASFTAANYMFYYTKKTSKVRITSTTLNALCNSVSYMFYGSTVKDIITPIGLRNPASTTGMFQDCVNLENVNIGQLNKSIEFKQSPNLTKRSILYMINNIQNSGTYAPTTAITITLHAEAYARLVDDEEVVAALEAKNTALAGTGGSISIVSA